MEWISVNDRLPDIDKHVLATDGDTVDISLRTSMGKDILWVNVEYIDLLAVTHWMPLPEPPDARKDRTTEKD